MHNAVSSIQLLERNFIILSISNSLSSRWGGLMTKDFNQRALCVKQLNHRTFCVLAARPTVPVANRTQKQLEPPVKTSACQPRVGRPRSGRKPNQPAPNNRNGRVRYTRWLYPDFCDFSRKHIYFVWNSWNSAMSHNAFGFSKYLFC